MKKRTLIMFAAGCLAAVTLLSSCVSCTITKPDDGSGTVTSDDGNSSNDEHPVIDFSKEDITKYIVLGDTKGLKLTYNVGITDELLDDTMKTIAKNNGYYTELITDRVTAKGDVLVIDFEGTMDGELFEGGSAENKTISLTESTGYIEGFDKDLYGVEAGTVVNTEVTFPDNYYEELAGKKAVFKITVKGIVKEFGFTDETVNEYTNGDYKTVADFREYSRKKIIKSNLEDFDSAVEDKLIDLIAEASEIKEIPQAQIDYYYYSDYNSAKAYYEQNKEVLQYLYGIASFEVYLQRIGMTEKALTDASTKEARRDIILVAYAKANGITVSDEEYEKTVEEMATSYGFSSVSALKESFGEIYLKLAALKDKTMKAIRASADLTTDYDEYSYLLNEEEEKKNTDSAPADDSSTEAEPDDSVSGE